MKPGSILTDVAGAKARIVREIQAAITRAPVAHSLEGKAYSLQSTACRVFFGPAHPLAGSEKSGIANAHAGLFDGATCIITPLPGTPVDAVATVRRFWQSLGATVCILTPAAHDRLAAQISRLPHLVAPALVNATSDAALPLAASGFKDATRIAASDPELWLDIFQDNRVNLLRALRRFTRQLDTARRHIERRDRPALARWLRRAQKRRLSLDKSP